MELLTKQNNQQAIFHFCCQLTHTLISNSRKNRAFKKLKFKRERDQSVC